MRHAKKNLGEAISHLSFTMEVLDTVRRKGTKSKEAIADIEQGLKALELSLDYFKLALVNVTKEETEKRNEDQQES